MRMAHIWPRYEDDAVGISEIKQAVDRIVGDGRAQVRNGGAYVRVRLSDDEEPIVRSAVEPIAGLVDIDDATCMV